VGLLALKTAKGRPLRLAQTAQEQRSRVAVERRPRRAGLSLPGPREALTREGFLELIQDALARVKAVYIRGLLERLSDEERQPMEAAEARVDAAFVDGDLETAREALEAWERAWLGALQARSERA